MGSLGGLGVKWESAEGQKLTQNGQKYRFFGPKYGCLSPNFCTLKVQERSKSSKIVFGMLCWVQKWSWTWIWRENEHFMRCKWAKKSLFLIKKGVFMHRFSKFKALEDLWECQNSICDVLLSLKLVLDLNLEQKWAFSVISLKIGKTSILVNRRVPTGERGHIIHQNDGFSSAVDLTLWKKGV